MRIRWTKPNHEAALTATASRREWTIFGAIFAAAALWRLTGLSAESLWTDEIAAVLVCRRPLLEVLLTIGVQDVNPPLFYLVAHAWLLAGDAEWWLRLLPAAAGLTMVVLTWRLGRRLGGATIGLVAAALIAFSPLAIYLSREFRYHTLVAVFALGALLAWRRLLEAPTRADRLWLFVCLVGGLYTHYFFLLVPLTLLAWWLLTPTKPPLLSVMQPLAGALLLFLPWLAVIAVQAMRASYRFRPLLPPADMAFDLFGYFTLGHADGGPPYAPMGWARLWYLTVLAPFFTLAAAGLAAWKDKPGVRLAVAGFLLPTTLVFLAALTLPVYGHRYLLPFLPLPMLWFAFGAQRLSALWRPLGAIVLAAALLLMNGSSLAQRNDPRFAREDWRGLADMLQTALADDDLLLAYNDSQVGPLKYYWEKRTGAPLRYRTLLSADPLTFTVDEPRAIQARVRLYRSQARRLWLLDHFAHMYEPQGVARRALAAICVEDPGYNLSAEYRIPLRVYWRSRGEAFKAVGQRFAPAIVFADGAFDDLQLAGAWTHTHEPWAWLGRTGTVYLRAETPADAVRLRVWPTPRYYGGQTMFLKLTTEDATLAEWTLTGDRPQTLVAPLPSPLAAGDILAVTLEPSLTFDPAARIGGADHSPKSLLVAEIGFVKQ